MSARIIRAVVLLCWSACGFSAGEDLAPPLFQVRGVITSSSLPTLSQVRVAVVWQKDGALKRAQELTVRAEFPARFTLDIHRLPPREMLAGGFAVGTLLAYEDVNGNDTLDLLPFDAERSVDRLLGVTEATIVFVQQASEGAAPVAHSSEAEPQGELGEPGFHLVLERSWQQTFEEGPVLKLLPPPTEVEMQLTAAPSSARHLCQPDLLLQAIRDPTPLPIEPGQPLWWRDTADGQHTEVGIGLGPPLPPGAELLCRPDAQAYAFRVCGAPLALCAAASCLYGGGWNPPGSPAPEPWPCP